jgi:enoyl-CoA hydratase/carnithine racemase
MFMPAARLGLHFYQRGMERYLTRLGLDMAKRLFLTAEKIDADQMLASGFLTHLIRHEDLENEVQRLTNCVADMAPMAILGMKRHLNQLARNVADAEQIKEDVMKSRRSADLLEGRQAWKEKRTPKFEGL